MSSAIFTATSRHAEWLAARRAVIAENIANASTPGFVARETAIFSLEEGSTVRRPGRTHESHLDVRNAASAAIVTPIETTTRSHSENTVELEQEIMKSGDVAREQTLNSALTRAFHRLVLLSVRG
jgi:flagellar basal-body rod protein FlgB